MKASAMTSFWINDVRLLFVGLGMAVLLGGCFPVKPDPDYAPAAPRVATPPPPTGGAIYQPGYSIFLFEDIRAKRVGDLLTIVLNENTSANKKADTKTSKKNEVSISNPTMFGEKLPKGDIEFTLDQSLESDQEFAGEGSSTQSNTLTGTITVTVVEVLANGNLAVRGEKLLTLNREDEIIRISGIVRPQDIRGDNSVFSTQVANARIIYSGKGAVADANANGWLGRFFQSPWWPF